MIRKSAARRQKPRPAMVEDDGSVQGLPAALWTHPPTIAQYKSGKGMARFHVGCKVVNTTDTSKSAVIPKLLADTGSDFTWIDEDILKRIGIEVQKTVAIEMANGDVLRRSVGFAILRVHRSFTVDEVVFARKGDLQLLGVRALEGLNLLLIRGYGNLSPAVQKSPHNPQWVNQQAS